MDDPAIWAQRLAAAATEQAAQPQQICELCVQMLGVSGAGIAMVTGRGHGGVVCATDERAGIIEDLQLTLGEGPCVDAVKGGAPVLVPDLEDRADLAVERWPSFLAGAAEAGVRAVFAFPLRIGAINVGALDLYRDTPGDLTRDELPGALLAADAAAIALLYLYTGRPSQGGWQADHRLQPHVHQATGMVQVQLGVPTEEAFLMLRARAFADGRPLAEIAADVVHRRVRFSREDS